MITKYPKRYTCLCLF